MLIMELVSDVIDQKCSEDKKRIGVPTSFVRGNLFFAQNPIHNLLGYPGHQFSISIFQMACKLQIAFVDDANNVVRKEDSTYAKL